MENISIASAARAVREAIFVTGFLNVLVTGNWFGLYLAHEALQVQSCVFMFHYKGLWSSLWSRVVQQRSWSHGGHWKFKRGNESG